MQLSVLDPASEEIKGKTPPDFNVQHSDFVKQRKTHIDVNSCS